MKYIFSIYLIMSFFASCEQVSNEQEITLAHLEQEMKKIHILIAAGSCETASNCHYMPYGSKACGGPQGYLIYSSNVDEEELEALVKSYTKKEDLYNRLHGIMSDCSIPIPPEKLDCQEGKCIELKETGD